MWGKVLSQRVWNGVARNPPTTLQNKQPAARSVFLCHMNRRVGKCADWAFTGHLGQRVSIVAQFLPFGRKRRSDCLCAGTRVDTTSFLSRPACARFVTTATASFHVACYSATLTEVISAFPQLQGKCQGII